MNLNYNFRHENVCIVPFLSVEYFFREIFYPDLYAEAGEGDLAEEHDGVGALPPPAVLSEADGDLALALGAGGGGGDGGGVEKRSSRAHALRVRNDASFHALRHKCYRVTLAFRDPGCINSNLLSSPDWWPATLAFGYLLPQQESETSPNFRIPGSPSK